MRMKHIAIRNSFDFSYLNINIFIFEIWCTKLQQKYSVLKFESIEHLSL